MTLNLPSKKELGAQPAMLKEIVQVQFINKSIIKKGFTTLIIVNPKKLGHLRFELRTKGL